MDTGLAMAVMSAAKAYKTAIRQFNEADPDFIDAACHRLRAAEAHFDAVYSRAANRWHRIFVHGLAVLCTVLWGAVIVIMFQALKSFIGGL